jgi:hypothetical protein
MEPHSVLIKVRSRVFVRVDQAQLSQTRDFILENATDNQSAPQSFPPNFRHKKTQPASKLKRAEPTPSRPKPKPRPRARRGKVAEVVNSDEEESISASQNNIQATSDIPPRRSDRQEQTVTINTYKEASVEQEGDEEIIMEDTPRDGEPRFNDIYSATVKQEEVDLVLNPVEQISPPSASEPTIELEIEEGEAKPKPRLQLRYQGFDIAGRCLCVVVEPWPPIRARSVSRAPSMTPSARDPSIAPPEFLSSGSRAARGQTPLFLPDDEDDEIMGIVASRSVPRMRKELPPVPAFDAPPEERDDTDEGDMMQFSQVLRTSNSYRAGADAEEDDDLDGAVFFGDADEHKEL